MIRFALWSAFCYGLCIYSAIASAVAGNWAWTLFMLSYTSAAILAEVYFVVRDDVRKNYYYKNLE